MGLFFIEGNPSPPIPSLFLQNSGFLIQEIIIEHLTCALVYYKVFQGLFLSLRSSVQPAPYYSYRLFVSGVIDICGCFSYRDLCSKTSADAREVALESQCVWR